MNLETNNQELSMDLSNRITQWAEEIKTVLIDALSNAELAKQHAALANGILFGMIYKNHFRKVDIFFPKKILDKFEENPASIRITGMGEDEDGNVHYTVELEKIK